MAERLTKEQRDGIAQLMEWYPCTWRQHITNWQFVSLLADLDAADAQIAALRPVVDAACACRDAVGQDWLEKEAELFVAVDAYRTAQKETVGK